MHGTPRSRGAGITAAADTRLAPRLFPRLLTAGKSPSSGHSGWPRHGFPHSARGSSRVCRGLGL